MERFGGFGEFEVVPEGVGKSFEDDELGVDVGVKQSPMKERGIAEQKIASAGNEESGRKALEVGEDGRENWVAAVGVAGVFVGAREGVGILRL